MAGVDRALELARELDAELAAEVDGLPVAGIANSNSPTRTQATDLRGRVLVQRSSAGVQAALAARGAGRVFAAALVNATATARAIVETGTRVVTLVASGAPLGHPEDRICAELIERRLRSRPWPELDELLAPVYRDPRYLRARAGEWPGCPASDMDLALAVDRFDFAMAVEPDGVHPDCATLYRR